jgi:hypothetical protein
VKLNKVTTEGVGTSFHLELTTAGETKVKKWLAEHSTAHILDSTRPTVAADCASQQLYSALCERQGVPCGLVCRDPTRTRSFILTVKYF